MGIGRRYWRVALYIHDYQKVMLFPLWKQHSVFKVPQDSSNSIHAQSDKLKLSAMLFVAWGVVIAQYWFSRQGSEARDQITHDIVSLHHSIL